MRRMKRSILMSLAVAATTVAAMAGLDRARAEEFPSRPITWIVPFTPGGITDTNARVVAQEMSKNLGVPVVIENRPGAGAMLGTEYGARSKPDGYTLIYGTLGTMAAQLSLQKHLRYDPVKDFEPVWLVAETPNVVVVPTERPYKTLQEFIDYAKKSPHKMKFASAGVGTGTHLAAELFKLASGVDMVHVPYKGSAPALTDLSAGRVDIMFDYLVSSSPYIQAGTLRPIAVTAAKRMSELPDIPTMTELGFPKATTGSWSGIFVPAGTPPAVVDRLAEAAKAATESEAVRNIYQKFGSTLLSMKPEEMKPFIAEQIKLWRDVITAAGIQPK